MAEVPKASNPAALTHESGLDGVPSLVPIIQDILRTRCCIPCSIFLVENIAVVPISARRRWQVIRLLLGDGELCVQALLAGSMHRFVEKGALAVGSYVQLDRFDVKWRRVMPEEVDSDDVADDDLCAQDRSRCRGRVPRQMVYLVVEDLVTIGWNESYRAAWKAERDRVAVVGEVTTNSYEPGWREGRLENDRKSDKYVADGPPAQPVPPIPAAGVNEDGGSAGDEGHGHDEDDDDDETDVDDAFEPSAGFQSA